MLSTTSRSFSTSTVTGLHEPFLARAAEPDTADSGSNGLGAFLVLRVVDHFAVDAPSVAPEAVSYQLLATREFLRDLHPQDAEVTTLREIVRVAQAAHDGGSRRMLIPPLLAFAFWLEEGLRLDEGLDVLDTALRLNDGRECEEEVATHLQRARVLRLCGRFEDAKVSYSEAGRLATEVGDTHSVLLSRIGRAIVLQRLGNLPEAERVLREIVDDARLVHDRDAEARALHDLSATLYAAGRVKEAIPAVFRAYELYERPLHRARALSDTGTLLKELGLYVAAKTALSLVLSHELSREVRARAVLELLELSTVVGDRMSFERWRRDLADTREHLPVDDLVDYEMKLGAGLARFGNSTQGEKHAERAIAIAEKHRLGERLFRAEELLTQLRGRRTDDAAPAATAEEPVVRDPELQSTLDGLHTLAESR